MQRTLDPQHAERNVLALALMTRMGIKLEIEKDSIEPLYHNDKFLGDRQKYEVTITREATGETLVFPFTASANDYAARIDPGDWEILYCIGSDGMIDDVEGLGYDPLEDAEKIEEIEEWVERLNDFFDEHELLEMANLDS